MCWFAGYNNWPKASSIGYYFGTSADMGTDCTNSLAYIAVVPGGQPSQGIVNTDYEAIWTSIGKDPVHYSVVCLDPDTGIITEVNVGGACDGGGKLILNQREYYRSKDSWCASGPGGPGDIGTILCDKLEYIIELIGDGPPLDDQH
jgi:hypothetical protein